MNWKVTLAIVVAVLLLASLAFVGLMPKSPSYPVDPSTFTKSATETDLITGMEITAEVNATSIRTGQGLSMTATSFNTRTQPVNLSVAGFPLAGMVGIEAPAVSYALGIAMYSGYYTLDNITSAKAVGFSPSPTSGSCRTAYFIFQPSSDNGTMYSVCGYGFTPENLSIFVGNPFDYTGTSTVFGACGSQNCQTEQSFNPGIYTIAVGAIWGQGEFVLLHFVIK